MLSKLEKKKIRVRLGNIYDTNKYKKFIDDTKLLPSSIELESLT